MSLRKLPKIKAFVRPESFHWDTPSDLLATWADEPKAAESDDPNTISIYDVIGEDFWTGGFTAKRAAGALRSIGSNDVTVKINSPGGDMFDGIAIYNLLREHPAKVTVKVMGLAASAASIIAMAGDEIRMGLGTFMMVHNAWGMVIGNRHDMRAAADLFDEFDGALVDVYEARTGLKPEDVESIMDAETFLSASTAVEKGFADAVDDGISAATGETNNRHNRNSGTMARRQTEAALAKAGFSRADRSNLLGEIIAANATPRDASREAERDAGIEAAMRQLITTIKS